MKRPRIVITGGSGILALNWACAVRDTWDVILGTHRQAVQLARTSSRELNLESSTLIGDEIDRLLPDVVVHTAALTNVDQCEEDKDLAYHANAEIARNVAEAAAKRRIPLVHISTDHLFDGKSSFYVEGDSPQPLNQYGKTKALAESWVQSAHPAALIVRTNFFCWGHKKRQSFTDWLITNLRKRKRLTLFEDVYFTPILADVLVSAVHDLVDKGLSGIVHVVGPDRVSKYEFGVRLTEQFGLSAESIVRGTMADVDLKAARPSDMSLDSSKVRQILNRSIGTVQEYLDALRVQERVGRHAELLESVM